MIRLRMNIVCVALILASAGVVSAQTLVSHPAGFVRVTIPSESSVLSSMPFDTQENPIGGQLMSGDIILKWSPFAQQYVSSCKFGNRWLDTNGVESKMEFVPGEAFWIVNRQSKDQSVVLAGQVVLVGTNKAVLYPALNLIAYPYSDSVPFNETFLWSCMEDGRINGEILSASSEVFTNGALAMGSGYWYRNDENTTAMWAELRPYEDVFPLAPSTPDIESIVVHDETNISLTILPAGSSLDIFYQDSGPSERLCTTGGWYLAETDLVVGNEETIQWVDEGNETRPPPGKVFARYYLIGRSDIDSDGDGIPDDREIFSEGTDPGVPVVRGTVVGLGGQGCISGPEGGTITSESGLYVTNIHAESSVRIHRVIYVDKKDGNDSFSGKLSIAALTDGPKRTIRNGLSSTLDEGLLAVRSGSYPENVSLVGRRVRIRLDGDVSISGPPKRPVIRHVEVPLTGSQTNLHEEINDANEQRK